MTQFEYLEAQLTLQEGKRKNVYRDSQGLETIGVGRNISASGPGLRDSEIALMLANDIQDCRSLAEKYPWFTGLNGPRQNVVLNLMFNLGPDRLATFKRFLAFMSAGDWQQAAGELKRSKWSTQVKGRADQLIAQLISGNYL